MTPAPASFRQRLLSSELLLGTFIKTPTTHATEILGGLGFDFVVIDEEHAAFDRVTIDNLLPAARASIAGIVRVAEPSPAKLLAALDDGAAGVLVPHVSSLGKAKEMVSASRYRRGKRGFSNSPRAGGYGQLGVWDHVDKANASVTVVAMIEDPEALDVIDDIVAVEGLDGVFIGRGDLTVAMGASGTADPRVRTAAEHIAVAARLVGKPSASWSPMQRRRRTGVRSEPARSSSLPIRDSCGKRRRERGRNLARSSAGDLAAPTRWNPGPKSRRHENRRVNLRPNLERKFQ